MKKCWKQVELRPNIAEVLNTLQNVKINTTNGEESKRRSHRMSDAIPDKKIRRESREPLIKQREEEIARPEEKLIPAVRKATVDVEAAQQKKKGKPANKKEMLQQPTLTIKKEDKQSKKTQPLPLTKPSPAKPYTGDSDSFNSSTDIFTPAVPTVQEDDHWSDEERLSQRYSKEVSVQCVSIIINIIELGFI